MYEYLVCTGIDIHTLEYLIHMNVLHWHTTYMTGNGIPGTHWHTLIDDKLAQNWHNTRH